MSSSKLILNIHRSAFLTVTEPWIIWGRIYLKPMWTWADSGSVLIMWFEKNLALLLPNGACEVQRKGLSSGTDRLIVNWWSIMLLLSTPLWIRCDYPWVSVPFWMVLWEKANSCMELWMFGCLVQTDISIKWTAVKFCAEEKRLKGFSECLTFPP